MTCQLILNLSTIEPAFPLFRVQIRPLEYYRGPDSTQRRYSPSVAAPAADCSFGRFSWPKSHSDRGRGAHGWLKPGQGHSRAGIVTETTGQSSGQSQPLTKVVASHFTRKGHPSTWAENRHFCAGTRTNDPYDPRNGFDRNRGAARVRAPLKVPKPTADSTRRSLWEDGRTNSAF